MFFLQMYFFFAYRKNEVKKRIYVIFSCDLIKTHFFRFEPTPKNQKSAQKPQN